MEELIELIQNGDISLNQILQKVTTIHNQSCDEMDAAMDRIEELEGKDTLNQIAILELRGKAVNAVNKVASQVKAIKTIETEGLKAVAHAQDFQNKLVVAEARLKILEKDMVDFKRQKLRIKRLTAANQSHQKGRKVLKQNMKKVKDDLEMMCRENAMLRITGHKKVGKYSYSIFPVKVHAGTAERQVGLVVSHEAGSMKVITRHPETKEINQPKAHSFKFGEAENQWMNEFFDVCDASNHQYTPQILRLVN